MTDYDEIMAMASSVKMKCLELNHKAEVLELAANTIKELDFRETFNNKRSPVRILLIDSTEPNKLGQDINDVSVG